MSSPSFDAGRTLAIVTRLHAKMERLQLRSIEVQVEGIATAAQIGTHLIAAQAAMPGTYQGWIERNYRRLRFGVRQARRYKVVARVVEESGGLECALSDLERLRAMQSALGYKLAELPEGEGEASDTAPRFEQFRIPCDPAAVPPDEVPTLLEKIEAMTKRLQEFCRALSERTSLSAS